MVPAVQELRDFEEDGSQGKRLLNLCSRVAAAQHTSACFESFHQPLSWGGDQITYATTGSSHLFGLAPIS